MFLSANKIMVPKHLRKFSDSYGRDEESLMTSVLELQGKIKNDKSILRQPIDTGVRGVRDLMKAVIGGTEELQDLLLNECTVIYECKICRNLFRSLANFISHKRIYCIKSFTYFTETTAKQEKEIIRQCDIALESEMVNCSKQVDVNNTKVWNNNCTAVSNNIKMESNNCLKSARRLKISSVKIRKKCDIAKIADGLNQRARAMKGSGDLEISPFHSEIAEKIGMRRVKLQPELTNDQNYQNYTSNDSVKNVCNGSRSELEIMDRLMLGNEAILQENGKFKVTPQGMQFESSHNFENYKCLVCETHFITQQALSRHVQIHHKERICYPCPICRAFFPSPSSTYRHLSKDHHKTEQQIRRLRPKVLSKAIKRKLVDGNSKPRENIQIQQTSVSSMEDVLKCSNCGKAFSRQAVLRVHLTSCKGRDGGKQAPNLKPIPTPAKLILPQENKLADCRTNLQKSGILVRKDYNKKLNYNSKSTTPLSSNSIETNHSSKGISLKRVNKWRKVLKKLHSRTGINVNDCSEVKLNDS